MEKILEYIFGNMQETDMVIRSINRTLRRQSRLNGRLLLTSVLTAGAVILLQRQKDVHEARIKKLEAEVNELKTVKGE